MGTAEKTRLAAGLGTPEDLETSVASTADMFAE